MEYQSELRTLEEIRSFLSRADLKTAAEEYTSMEKRAERLAQSLDRKRTQPDPIAGLAYAYVLDLRDAISGRAVEQARFYADAAVKFLQERSIGPESLSVEKSSVMKVFDRSWAETKLKQAGFEVEDGTFGGKPAFFVSFSNRHPGFREVSKSLEPSCQPQDLQRGVDGRIVVMVQD